MCVYVCACVHDEGKEGRTWAGRRRGGRQILSPHDESEGLGPPHNARFDLLFLHRMGGWMGAWVGGKRQGGTAAKEKQRPCLHHPQKNGLHSENCRGLKRGRRGGEAKKKAKSRKSRQTIVQGQTCVRNHCLASILPPSTRMHTATPPQTNTQEEGEQNSLKHPNRAELPTSSPYSPPLTSEGRAQLPLLS